MLAQSKAFLLDRHWRKSSEREAPLLRFALMSHSRGHLQYMPHHLVRACRAPLCSAQEREPVPGVDPAS